MAKKIIDPITPEQLADILGVDPGQIIDREGIGKELSSKRKERIDYRVSSTSQISRIFLKYSYNQSMAKEVNLYNEVFQPFLGGIVDHIPKAVASGILNNRLHVLCTEYIEGHHPDLTDRAVVGRVFKQLGEWGGHWNQVLERYQQGRHSFQNTQFIDELLKKEPLHQLLAEVIQLSNSMKPVINELGGKKLFTFFDRLGNGLDQEIVRQILNMPIAFDPGDLSKYNTFIRQADGAVIFIDFENAWFRPMTQMVQYLGDNDVRWSALPLGDLVDYALHSFFQGWNRSAASPLAWDQFMIGYRASRVYYKCYLLKHWLPRINGRNRSEDVMEWAKEASQDLLLTAKEAGYI